MELFANIGLGMVGFLLGTLLFARVGRWAVTVFEVSTRRTAGSLASVMLLSSGPWFAVAAGIFAFYVYSASWALPGAVIAIAFFSLLSLYLARKAARSKAQNAT